MHHTHARSLNARPAGDAAAASAALTINDDGLHDESASECIENEDAAEFEHGASTLWAVQMELVEPVARQLGVHFTRMEGFDARTQKPCESRRAHTQANKRGQRGRDQ